MPITASARLSHHGCPLTGSYFFQLRAEIRSGSPGRFGSLTLAFLPSPRLSGGSLLSLTAPSPVSPA